MFLTPITDDAIPVTWDNAEEIGIPATDLEKSAQGGAQFSELPPAASQAKNYAAWNKDFTNWLYGTQVINLVQSPSLKLVSQPGEDERDFRIRAGQVAREKRDELVEALRKKYAPKIATLQERLRKAQAAVEKQAGAGPTSETADRTFHSARHCSARSRDARLSAAAPSAKRQAPHAGPDVPSKKAVMSHAPMTR